MEDYFRCPIIGPCNSKVPSQNWQTLRVWRQSSSEQNQLVVQAEFGFGGGGQALSACKSLANKLRFWAGDIMIGLNRRGPIFLDPGPIFEFNMPNPSVW